MKKLYNDRQKVIKFCNDYTRMGSEAKCKSVHGDGLKILTPKQMLLKLPIALDKYILCIKKEKLHKKYIIK